MSLHSLEELPRSVFPRAGLIGSPESLCSHGGGSVKIPELYISLGKSYELPGAQLSIIGSD